MDAAAETWNLIIESFRDIAEEAYAWEAPEIALYYSQVMDSMLNDSMLLGEPGCA